MLVRAGDAAAFEELYERHCTGLLSFCRHMLGSQEEAEDAVQHTFLAAHKALLADDREIHLKAWLYAIARNRCLSMLRSRRERVGYDDELEGLPSTAGLSAEVEQREDLRAMLGDLAKLPEDQRAALLLSELGAHSHDDVAEVLGVRREKVKALVFQAREGLSAARTARETPCGEIREQLATARGGALRRGNLRRHLDACAGCRAFRDEVHRQRVAFGAILPVVPSLALKQAVLTGVGAMGAGAGTVAGAAALSTAGGLGAKATAAKLMTIVAVAGGATGTGYVTVHEVRRGHDVPSAVAQEAPPKAGNPDAARGEPIAQTTPLPPSAATPPTPPAGGHRVTIAEHTSGRRTHKTSATSRHRTRHHRRHATVALEPAAAVVAPVAPVVAEPEPEREDEHGHHKGKKDKHKSKDEGHGKGKGHEKAAKPEKSAKPKEHPAHPHGGPPGQLKKKKDKRRHERGMPPGLQGKHNHGAEIHAQRRNGPGAPKKQPNKPLKPAKPRVKDLVPVPAPDPQSPATPPLGSDTPSSRPQSQQEDVAKWPSKPGS